MTYVLIFIIFNFFFGSSSNGCGRLSFFSINASAHELLSSFGHVITRVEVNARGSVTPSAVGILLALIHGG